MASYRLKPQAEDDLTGIYFYGLKRFGVERADTYLQGLLRHFELLVRQPSLFKAMDDEGFPGYRRSVYRKENVFYRVLEDGNIEIVRIVRHQYIEELE